MTLLGQTDVRVAVHFASIRLSFTAAFFSLISMAMRYCSTLLEKKRKLSKCVLESEMCIYLEYVLFIVGIHGRFPFQIRMKR